MNIEYFNPERTLPTERIEPVVDFLHTALEQYGDPKGAIRKAIDYAMNASAHGGGLVAVMYDKQEIIAATVINKTGMKGYIPENILVYIAVHREHRGHGAGKTLLSAVLEHLDGDFALHVEPENPAMHLYRSMGFSEKYREMRLHRKEVE